MEFEYKPLDGLFNERKKTRMAYRVGFHPIDEENIDEEKRKIYQYGKERGKLGERVPFIVVAAIAFETKEENRELIQFFDDLPPESNPIDIVKNGPWTAIKGLDNFVGLMPNFHQHGEHPDVFTTNGKVFQLLIHSRRNTRDNYHIATAMGNTDLVLIHPFDRENEKEDVENRKRWGKLFVDKWLTLKTDDDIHNLMKELITERVESSSSTKKELANDFEFLVQRWFIYAKKILFQNPESRLFPLRNETGDGFSIDAVEFLIVDLNNRERDWRELLSVYRKENPDPKFYTLTTHLSTRPSDGKILDPGNLSFIAYHKRDKKMIGYVVFSLSSLNRSDYEMGFKTTELKLFDEYLKRGEPLGGFGFDIFNLDGIHLHMDYKGYPLSNAMTIPKVLVYFGLEFIRHSHDLLGVKIITSAAYSVATKEILVNTFGFKHHNRHNELKWMTYIFTDFKKRLLRVEEKVETPVKLLQLGELSQRLNSFMVEYDYPKSHPILVEISNTMTLLLEKFGPRATPEMILESSSSNGGTRKTRSSGSDWISALIKAVNYLEEFQKKVASSWMAAEKRPGDEEEQYMKNLRYYLNSGNDDEDTFLFIAAGETVSRGFSQKLDNFPLSPQVLSPQQPDTLGNEQEFVNPTEEEMTLYFAVIRLSSSPPPTNVEKEKEEEEEVIEISIDNDIQDEKLHEREEEFLKKEKNQLAQNTTKMNSLEKRTKDIHEQLRLDRTKLEELVQERANLEASLTKVNEEIEKHKFKQVAIEKKMNEEEKKMEKLRSENKRQNIIIILRENYLKKNQRENLFKAQEEIKSKLLSLGYDETLGKGEDLEKIVIEMKEKFPLLLDYEALEIFIRNEKHDVTMGELIRNYMSKFSLSSLRDYKESEEIMSSALKTTKLCVKKDTKRKIYSQLRDRFPSLLNYPVGC